MKFPRWELRYTADPLDTRAYGGGGDGGAGAMREEEQKRQDKVQAAVDAINAKFGVASGSAAVAPGREAFTKAARTKQIAISDGSEGGLWDRVETVADPDSPMVFDESGYNKALADWQAAQAAPGAAKTARDALYADIHGAVKDTAMRGVDRQFTEASKNNLFGLARSGLLGGSVDAESAGELQTLYGEGKLKAAQAGQQAASDLRVTDEKTRQNLIGLAQSGLDTGTAASMAASQMGAAGDLARNQTAGANVGRLFDDMGQAYLTNQSLKGRYPNGLPQQQPSGYNSSMWGSPSKNFGKVQS